jgi:hypothetical protein
MRQPFSFRPLLSQMIQRDQVSRFSDCGHDLDGDFSKGNTCASSSGSNEKSRPSGKYYYVSDRGWDRGKRIEKTYEEVIEHLGEDWDINELHKEEMITLPGGYFLFDKDY